MILPLLVVTAALALGLIGCLKLAGNREGALAPILVPVYLSIASAAIWACVRFFGG